MPTTKERSDKETKKLVHQILDEGAFPITEIPKRMGIELDPQTPYRWVVKGVAGIRLPAVKFGRAYYTSENRLRLFLENTATLR